MLKAAQVFRPGLVSDFGPLRLWCALGLRFGFAAEAGENRLQSVKIDPPVIIFMWRLSIPLDYLWNQSFKFRDSGEGVLIDGHAVSLIEESNGRSR